MIDSLNIVMMVVALVLILAIPVVAFLKFKKHPKLVQGILWGFISFFLFNIISMLLSMFVGTVFFPSPGEGIPSPILENNNLLVVGITAAIAGLAFLISGLVTYRFQLKRIDDKELPILNTLIFNTMLAFGIISQLISNILLSINANAGNLDKYVTAELSLESLEATLVQFNEIPALVFFDLGLSHWLDIVVFGIGFVLLYKFSKKDGHVSPIQYILGAFLVVFSYRLVGGLSAHFLGHIAILPILVKVAFTGLVYLGFKRFTDRDDNQVEIIEVN